MATMEDPVEMAGPEEMGALSQVMAAMVAMPVSGGLEGQVGWVPRVVMPWSVQSRPLPWLAATAAMPATVALEAMGALEELRRAQVRQQAYREMEALAVQPEMGVMPALVGVVPALLFHQ